jgi:hypothetical protein
LKTKNKIINFNFISHNNEVIMDPKYKAILMGDNYVNQIDFGIFDKKNNLKDNLFKFPLIKRKVEGSDDFSNSDSKSEKDENHDINNFPNYHVINLNKSNSSKLENECLLLSNTFSNSTKDSIRISSPTYKKKKKRLSILKNKRGNSSTKIRENRSINKKVSFGSFQISFYKSQIVK